MATIINEQGIREMMPESVLKIMNSWRVLTQELFGYPIEIAAMAKNEHPQFSKISHNLHLAYPHVLDGKVVLIVVVNDFNNVPYVVFAHEISHWILKLKGYQGLLNKKDKLGLLAAHINDLCTHPPVWKLIKESGLDPQDEIDSRATYDINLLLTSAESKDPLNQKTIALYICDDLINCSSDLKVKLNINLLNKYPATYSYVQQILGILRKYDLNKPDDNNACIIELQNELYLPGRWSIPEEINEIKKKIAQVKK